MSRASVMFLELLQQYVVAPPVLMGAGNSCGCYPTESVQDMLPVAQKSIFLENFGNDARHVDFPSARNSYLKKTKKRKNKKRHIQVL